ncbi:hypothetical protein H4R35_006478 [Dimargaris xerosporica]|nr:hypothetical protein H4R35_006478 [Dimargaris xerosporica]
MLYFLGGSPANRWDDHAFSDGSIDFEPETPLQAEPEEARVGLGLNDSYDGERPIPPWSGSTTTLATTRRRPTISSMDIDFRFESLSRPASLLSTPRSRVQQHAIPEIPGFGRVNSNFARVREALVSSAIPGTVKLDNDLSNFYAFVHSAAQASDDHICVLSMLLPPHTRKPIICQAFYNVLGNQEL